MARPARTPPRARRRGVAAWHVTARQGKGKARAANARPTPSLLLASKTLRAAAPRPRERPCRGPCRGPSRGPWRRGPCARTVRGATQSTYRLAGTWPGWAGWAGWADYPDNSISPPPRQDSELARTSDGLVGRRQADANEEALRRGQGIKSHCRHTQYTHSVRAAAAATLATSPWPRRASVSASPPPRVAMSLEENPLLIP